MSPEAAKKAVDEARKAACRAREASERVGFHARRKAILEAEHAEAVLDELCAA